MIMQREVRSYSFRLPSEGKEIALAALKVHARFNRFIAWHRATLAGLTNVRNPPKAATSGSRLIAPRFALRQCIELL